MPSPQPQPDFDRVARIYRWAEYLALGPLLQQTRTHFLPQLTGRRRALVLGDGDGRFLTQLLHQNPNLHAIAVDTSATMLTLLTQRCTPRVPQVPILGPGRTTNDSRVPHSARSTWRDGWATTKDRATTKPAPPNAPRLQTLHLSALTVSAPPDTDLIVTHFFLDCLTQPELNHLTHRLAGQVQPGTLWLLSDFAVPPTGPLRPFAALYIRALYLAFRILTGLRVTQLPDPQSALTAAGFTRIAHHNRLAGILYTELWQRQ